MEDRRWKVMIYKIRKMSEGVYIKVKYESDESIDRLELSRFSNADLKYFITDTEIKGKSVIVKTDFDVTLSEYIKNKLSFQTIVLLLRECIEAIKSIVKNKFLLMYVDFNMEHIFISTSGSLQFLYLPTEEERDSSGSMIFLQKVLEDIKPSDGLAEELLKNIKNNVENMAFYSSHDLFKIIESAEKEYFKMLETKDNKTLKENKEALGDTSYVYPHIYNLSTGKIMKYNSGDVIVFSDRNVDDINKKQVNISMLPKGD